MLGGRCQRQGLRALTAKEWNPGLHTPSPGPANLLNSLSPNGFLLILGDFPCR